jgi:hypothetical protein
MVFERKIFRKIFGPVKVSEGRWRIRTNDELDILINHANIVRYVKAQRISWLGHIERTPDDRTVKKITDWKPIAPRHIGIPKLRWEEDVRNDLKAMKVQDWKKLAQNRNKWKGIIEQAKSHVELCSLKKKKKKKQPDAVIPIEAHTGVLYGCLLLSYFVVVRN